jgi:hypothetical protein
MDKLKIRKLKITNVALQQLQQLHLSLADLDLIICFSREIIHSCATLYQFDLTLAPASIRPQLAHLPGFILRAVSGEVVDIYRDNQALSNTGKGEQTIT